MQNRKWPAGIIRFAAPGTRKTHTQVKTHRLRILFASERKSWVARTEASHTSASSSKSSGPTFTTLICQ